MKRTKVNFILSVSLFVVSSLLLSPPADGQKNKDKTPVAATAITRTTTRHENRRLSYGGTVTIAGAPAGSITIEGWSRNEVDVVADIELHAASETDLAALAIFNNFVIDEDSNHIRILTTGTHDRSFMKRVAKNVPKSLLNQPWKIDYRIKVPSLCDLDISQGIGKIRLSGVEGALHLNAIQSEMALALTGGAAGVTIQQGDVMFAIPARSWHGLGAEVRLATGNLVIELPPGYSGDIDAEVLRDGYIEVNYPGLEARERDSITSRLVRGRTGSGGSTLSFTVGDGTITIKQAQ